MASQDLIKTTVSKKILYLLERLRSNKIRDSSSTIGATTKIFFSLLTFFPKDNTFELVSQLVHKLLFHTVSKPPFIIYRNYFKVQTTFQRKMIRLLMVLTTYTTYVLSVIFSSVPTTSRVTRVCNSLLRPAQ